MPVFQELGAQVLGINVDSFFAHKVFSDNLKLNFPLLSDFNREVIPIYTDYYDDVFGLKQVGRRTVFVIDRKGIVRYKWTTDNPGNIPNIDDVIEALRNLEEEFRIYPAA